MIGTISIQTCFNHGKVLEMTTFYDRLKEVVKHSEAATLNIFALDKLKYDSSSKLTRLKHPENNPSVEIVLDIKRLYPEIDLNWLLTGDGEMLVGGQQNAQHKPGIAELIGVLEIQNDILRKGFNLDGEKEKPLTTHQSPDPASQPNDLGLEQGTGRIYSGTKKLKKDISSSTDT